MEYFGNYNYLWNKLCLNVDKMIMDGRSIFFVRILYNVIK